MRLVRPLAVAWLAAVMSCSGSDPPYAGPDAATDTPTSESAVPELGAWHRLVPDPGGRGVLLVNGYPEDGSGADPLDLWLWDGNEWSELDAADGPSGRNFAATAYETSRDVVVLYGGQTAEGTSEETWEWDGATWHRVEVDGPGPRSAAAMTYDEERAEVLLYGGDDGAGSVKADTWAWDGSAWQRLATQGPEPVRWPAMMEYDAASKQVVLYGGHQVVDEAASPALGDTWLWDGSRWQRSGAPDPPGELVNAAGLGHPDLGLVLLGGSDMNEETSAMWQWTGRGWEPLSDSVFPPRQAFGLAYDASRRIVVLTGGVVEPGSTERHQDVWEWSGDPADQAELIE